MNPGGAPTRRSRHAGPADPSGHPIDLRLVALTAGCWLADLTVQHLTTRAALTFLVTTAVLAAAALLTLTRLRLLVRLRARDSAPVPRSVDATEPVTRAGDEAEPAAASASGSAPARRAVVVAAVIATASLGAVCGAAVTEVAAVPRDLPMVRQAALAHAPMTADATVAGDPHPETGRPGSWVVPADLSRLAPAGGPASRIRGRVVLLGSGPGWAALLPGQPVTVTGRASAPKDRDLTVLVLSVPAPPGRRGAPPWYQRYAERLRSGLRHACDGLPAGTDGLLPGLVDGDTSRLAPAIKGDFQTAGMSHLTAVSGENLSIVVGLVLLLARWARAGPRPAAALGLVATAGFVVLARPEPSVLRAAAMGVLMLIALMLGRPGAAMPALAVGTAALLLFDPQLAADAGFALSALATAGLLLLAPPLIRRLGRRLPAPVAVAVAVPVAAQLGCAPLLAGMSGGVALVAVPANLLAEPLVAPATALGVAATAVSPLWPPGAHLLAWLASWPCRWLIAVAHAGAALPAATLPWPAGTTGALVLAALLLAVPLAVLALRRTGPARPAALSGLIAVAAGALLATVTGWPGAAADTRPATLMPAPPSTPSRCRARDGPRPDPHCTPGAIATLVSPATIRTTICRTGWTATIRPPAAYTTALKRDQIAAYGYRDHNLADYEEDHLVPLSLGGDPTDPRNLWPEPGASPNTKDDVESALRIAVCTGRTRLADAQRAIATDWTTAEHRLRLG